MQLNVLVTHQGRRGTALILDHLARTCPESRFVVCHGGRRPDFEAIEHPEKLFITDPTLRAPPRSTQSYTELLTAVQRAFVAEDPEVESIYVFEYDHVILRGDFESSLAAAVTRSGADFLGKSCVDRTGTNWHHYTRYRDDVALLDHLANISVRDDPRRIFGCLGDGFWLTRRALQAYVSAPAAPPCYGEVLLPTVIHHLGFRIADLAALGDLYDHVRYQPVYRLDELEQMRDGGATFVHPFKEIDVLPLLASGPGKGAR